MPKVWFAVLFLGIGASLLLAEDPPKDLVEYIAGAKKLGLPDEEIRRNAAAAGWDVKLIEEAFSAASRPAGGAGSSSDGAPVLSEGYRIGAGDVIGVSVYKEPEASVGAALVRADGKITLPLIKEITIAGLTPGEAEKVITEKLSRFVRTPDVTVIVSQVHSQKVYLVGGVRSVKPIELRGRLTVLQAITEAGGLTDYAKRKKIYILRNDNGKQVRLPFDYDAVIRGEKMDQNITLLPDDTIVVPQ